MYGITETTVHVTHRPMRIADANERESLMGEPIPGWTIELIDDEICVGGVGVARGYLGRPELTAERFVGGLYRSGDLARRRADGELVYLGRRDGQVKLNGFRIETGEVEAALLGCAGVQQACVIVREGRMVAYLVGPGSPAAELKAQAPEPHASLRLRAAACPASECQRQDRSQRPARTRNANRHGAADRVTDGATRRPRLGRRPRQPAPPRMTTSSTWAAPPSC